MTKRSCVVCGSSGSRPLFRPLASPGPVVRCPHCGLVYVGEIQHGGALVEAPVLAGERSDILQSCDLKDLAGSWELRQLPAKEAEWPALRLNARYALTRIAAQVPPPGRLLDFGCGWGFFLGAAAEVGWTPFGLEPLPGHAIYARAHFGATVTTDVLHANSFPPETFDAITAFQVFEHLPDPAGDLARLFRMAKPGAAILIEVPNIETLAARLLGPRHRHFNPDHLTFFSARTLALLFEKCGFEVVETYYPTRNLTVGHLSNYWAQRYLPRQAANRLRKLVTLRHWDSHIVRINLHDIVALVGRKPI